MYTTSHNQRHAEEQVDIFPCPNIQHSNNINAPVKWASTCGMQYHEKHHVISQWSIIGRIIWNVSESSIYKNWPSRSGPLATTNTVGSGKYSGKQHCERNGKYRATDMILYWVWNRIWKKHFHKFWEEGKKKMADYVTKTTNCGTT